MDTDIRKTTDCRRLDDPDRCARCETCLEPCQVYEGDKPCGETQTLQIIKEFRELYERKMQQIESTGGGDCAQAKINLQQEWIRDLTEQNEMLIRAIEELEQEATERVRLLEQKLNRTASTEKEVMRKYSQVELAFNVTGALQQVAYLQSDVKNLLELIRRVREENSWNVEGLKFHQITSADILGHRKISDEGNRKENKQLFQSPPINSDQKVQTADDDEKNKKIAELEEELQKLKEVAGTSQILETLEEHGKLKKSMLEMRDALTAEVAEKHDIILSLKHDILRLEEQCLQINKHAQFKDDIIKELRKEVKQLRQNVQDHFFEKQIVVLNQESELNATKNEAVIYMREGSITSTPIVSDCESMTNEAFIKFLREQPTRLSTTSGIRPHPVAPLTNLFDPTMKTHEKIKQKASIKSEIQKKDTFVQHRSLLKKSVLTKRLRAATISSYSYTPKEPGV